MMNIMKALNLLDGVSIPVQSPTPSGVAILLESGLYDFINGKVIRNEANFNILKNITTNPDYQISIPKIKVNGGRYNSHCLTAIVKIEEVKTGEVLEQLLYIYHRHNQFDHWTITKAFLTPVLETLLKDRITRHVKRLTNASTFQRKLQRYNLDQYNNIYLYNLHHLFADLEHKKDLEINYYPKTQRFVLDDSKIPQSYDYHPNSQDSFIMHMLANDLLTAFDPMQVKFDGVHSSNSSDLHECLQYQLFDVIDGNITNYSEVAKNFKAQFGSSLKRILEENLHNWKLTSYNLDYLQIQVSLNVDGEEIQFRSDSSNVNNILEKMQEFNCKDLLYKGILNTISGKCIVDLLEKMISNDSNNSRYTFIRELASYNSERGT